MDIDFPDPSPVACTTGIKENRHRYRMARGIPEQPGIRLAPGVAGRLHKPPV
ncbi:MAG: hypothetical protein LUQ69_06960 [Methanoregulaceae archaeon]|nr:hypothetical protein [Methanoregulaceae archaeon]